MKTYLLPEEIRDMLIQYLSSRPWAEVENGMHKLLDLQLLPESEPEKKE